MTKLETYDTSALQVILYYNIAQHDGLKDLLKDIEKYEIDDYELTQILSGKKIVDPKLTEFKDQHLMALTYFSGYDFIVGRELISLSASKLFEDIDKDLDNVLEENKYVYLKLLLDNVSSLDKVGIRNFKYNDSPEENASEWYIFENPRNVLTAVVSNLSFLTVVPDKKEIEAQKQICDENGATFILREKDYAKTSIKNVDPQKRLS